MSLTGELDKATSPVSRWFDEWLPNTAPIGKEWYAKVKPVPIQRPDTERRVPGTVGTAFDYRLRYFFAETALADLVAGAGMRLLDASGTSMGAARAVPDSILAAYGTPPVESRAASALIEPFSAGLAALLERCRPARALPAAPEEELCRYCYVLGWFEELYRAGLRIRSPLYTLRKGATLEDLLALPEAIWINDLRQLSASFAEHFEEVDGEQIILNPLFAGSAEIGGADADLIVDGCLIDIKTTVDPKFSKRRLLYQLLGYVLLDYDDRYEIRAVAIYLSRQALVVRFELDPLLRTLSARGAVSLPVLRNAFREALQPSR